MYIVNTIQLILYKKYNDISFIFFCLISIFSFHTPLLIFYYWSSLIYSIRWLKIKRDVWEVTIVYEYHYPYCIITRVLWSLLLRIGLAWTSKVLALSGPLLALTPSRLIECERLCQLIHKLLQIRQRIHETTFDIRFCWTYFVIYFNDSNRLSFRYSLKDHVHQKLPKPETIWLLD